MQRTKLYLNCASIINKIEQKFPACFCHNLITCISFMKKKTKTKMIHVVEFDGQ